MRGERLRTNAATSIHSLLLSTLLGDLNVCLGRISRAKGKLITVTPTDCTLLKSWQRSHDRRKWEVSVALLGLSSGHTLSAICQKIGRARRTVKKWCATFERVGMNGLPIKRSRKLSEKSQTSIRE